MSVELGKILVSLRKSSELTQKQIADVLHIDRSTYAYYEKGTTEPSLKALVTIARVLNVDPAIFLPDDDDIDTNVADKVAENKDFRAGSITAKVKSRANASKIYALSKSERGLLIKYRALDEKNKKEIIEEIGKRIKNI